jgi:hypothetical protein
VPLLVLDELDAADLREVAHAPHEISLAHQSTR